MRKIVLLIILCMVLKQPLWAQTSSKDQTAIKTTITHFYQWYNVHWKKINAFKLYRPKKGDAPPYTIDWKQVQLYFAFIKKNVPQLGNAFIENERQYFKNAQKQFDQSPEEEIAIGFDYDRFTNTQEEPQYVVPEILNKKRRWKINIDKNTAIVYIYHLESDKESDKDIIELTKEKGVWTIAKCITTFSE
ncbi:MAG: hypothetical protein ACOYKE_04030 [Ferruginibacter sp.]